MNSTQVDLLDIVHVKVGFFTGLKMGIIARLEKFVWSTLFAQCVFPMIFLGIENIETENGLRWSDLCMKAPIVKPPDNFGIFGKRKKRQSDDLGIRCISDRNCNQNNNKQAYFFSVAIFII